MPDAAMIRKQVDARLAELEVILDPLRVEYEQLRSLAAAYDADAPRPPGRPTAPAAPGPVRRGGRAEQALALVTAQPGVTASEMAAALGVSRNYLYRVLPKLERRGMIRKRDGGYQPAA